MAGMLNFTEENRMKVGLIAPNATTVRKGWLGWLASPISSQQQVQIPHRASLSSSTGPAIEGKNFADLWIEFLLKEAENERNVAVVINDTAAPPDPAAVQPPPSEGPNGTAVQNVNIDQVRVRKNDGVRYQISRFLFIYKWF